MTEILLGPVMTDAPSVKITDKEGKVFWKKQILPEGKFVYKDGELDLSADTIKAGIAAFKDKAFDEVPFNFGGTHSDNDPKKRAGTMVDVEYVEGKGAFGVFDFSKSPEMTEHIQKFPKFGVSPRIFLDHSRADGKKYGFAFQHVLGTDTPVMSGMDGWDSVSLSSDLGAEVNVYDFSMEVEKAEPVTSNVVKPVTKTVKDDKVTLPEGLTPELIKFMQDEFAKTQKQTPPVTQITDVKIPEFVSLSLDAHDEKLKKLEERALKAEWTTKRGELLRQGVPPAQLDLAEPVMLLPEDRVIDLSTPDGTVKISDKTQMLGILEGMKGMVPLDKVDLGHGVGGQEPSDVSDTAEQVDEWLRANNVGR